MFVKKFSVCQVDSNHDSKIILKENTLTVSELNFGLSRENVKVEVSNGVVQATIGLVKNALLDYFFGHVSSLVKQKYKEILVDLFQ